MSRPFYESSQLDPLQRDLVRISLFAHKSHSSTRFDLVSTFLSNESEKGRYVTSDNLLNLQTDTRNEFITLI